jgi:hypothetical protein
MADMVLATRKAERVTARFIDDPPFRVLSSYRKDHLNVRYSVAYDENENH